MRVESSEFLSTPSARRATTPAMSSSIVEINISIHALREEGDRCDRDKDFSHVVFLSTPSARRATIYLTLRGQHVNISIHALREEGDSQAVTFPSMVWHFYPRPPRGGRQISP